MIRPVHGKDFEIISALDPLNDLLGTVSFRAGWNKHEPSLWPHPRTAFHAAHWRYDLAKPALATAGNLISTELAERRNLFMVNPCEGNYYATLRTLVAAYQMLLPGEKARSHRHTPNALRLILDVPEKTYTVVDGVRIDMMPNDVVLTPGWTWHGHGNDGDQAGYWIDFLDVPLIQLLEPMFLEHWPEGFQTPTAVTRYSPYVFPWAETQAKLDAAEADEFGRVAITLDAPSMPTITMRMERIAAGQSVRVPRSTANQLAAVVAGVGTATVGGRAFQWGRGDTITVPSWHDHTWNAEADAVLFWVSDEAVLEKLGLLRQSDPSHS